MAKEKSNPEVAAGDVASAESLRSARPSTDVSIVLMTIVGIIGTLAISYGVFPFKNHANKSLAYIYGIVNQRGPVQYLELAMSLMVGMMIYLKARVVRKNLEVIAVHPIPADLDLNDDKALQEFRESLPKRPEFGWSILLNRVDRAIALWLGSKDVGRVSSWLGTESARDQAASDSSYAMSRVLMWAVPILGFIGTVQGLGQAVAGFGVLGGSAGVEAIKGAIGQVTVGLGVAFDTTLLALILTTFLMFPLTTFQRREENLFGEMDNYLDDVFLARLPSPEAQPIVIENLEDSIESAFRRYIPDPDRYDEVFTRSIDKAAATVEERFGNLSKSYEVTVKDLTEKLSANLANVGVSLENTLRAVVGDVRKQDEAMLATRRQVGQDEAERFKGMLTDIHGTADKVAQQYRQSAETIQSATRESTNQSLSAAKDLASRMEEVSRMAAGIQDLLKINQAVEKGLAGITQSDDFRKTLEDLRKHLNVTTDFCTRLSKPRVITLSES